MVHQYKLNGYHIVLDTCSGSVHAVDEIAYDLIALFEAKSEDEIVAELLSKYGDRADVSEDELRECYPNPKVSEYQAADAITLEVMDYIANEPLVKAILTGHMHFDYDSVYANRIPQLCTACRTLRVVEFV